MMRLLFIKILLWLSVFLYSEEIKSQNYPSHTITNGMITAKIYLPDSEAGFYRASRFDGAGIIYELKYKGCDYFGQWYSKHDPKVNDAICGPAEEFAPIGWHDEDNENFLKIGVGWLRRPQADEYDKFRLYEVANPGKWTITPSEHKIQFIHVVENVSGYSYRYTKCIELVADSPKLLVKHRSENTGKKLIRTNVYNHNFFTIGHLPTNFDITVTFPEEVSKGTYNGKDDILHIDNNKIEFKRQLAPAESVMMFNVLGDRVTNGPITIENKKLKAGVCITSDTEYSTVHFWASERTYCPEPYIDIEVMPLNNVYWEFEYNFYVK